MKRSQALILVQVFLGHTYGGRFGNDVAVDASSTHRKAGRGDRVNQGAVPSGPI